MRFAPCKGIQDTLPDSIYWIPDLFQWNLDSGFELLVGFRIPTPVFRIPRPRIPDSTRKNFQDSGFQMQKFPGFRNPDSFTRGECVGLWKHNDVLSRLMEQNKTKHPLALYRVEPRVTKFDKVPMF